MRSHSNAIVRPILSIGLIVAAYGCRDKPLPIQIEKYCVSESGLSKYRLSLNTSEKRGEIRYQFMGQDVRYVVKAMQMEGGTINGSADFHVSSTGETRGNPINFSYDSDTNTLRDGSTSAACRNFQNAPEN